MSAGLPSIPSSWSWATASDLIEGIESGKSFKCDERPPEDGEVGVVKVSAVTWGTYNEAESKTCTRPEMVNDSKFIRPGDFLFSRANTIDLVGACVIADCVNKQVMLSDKILRFAVRAEWDRWLMWLLRSVHGRSEIQSLATGNQNSMRNIGQARIRQIRLPLPPLPEQNRIVEAIESYFTRLGDAVATLERVQRNLKRYRASVLKAAVEGRLVPTEVDLARAEDRDYEPASVLLDRILEERRQRWAESEKKGKYKEPVEPDADGLPELPEGWCWTTIGGVAECLDRLRVPVSKKVRAERLGDVPYYGANGQVGWIDEPLFDEPLVLVVEDETFTGRTKPFCYLIDGPSWVNNHAHVLRPIGGVSPEFLNYSLAHYPFTPLTTGTTGRRKLTQKVMMAAPYALPPLAEQRRIVERLEGEISLVDALGERLEGDQRRCQRLRQSILKWAFEGKLADQDPDDESASVLLERIRTERDAMKPKKTRRARPRKNA